MVGVYPPPPLLLSPRGLRLFQAFEITAPSSTPLPPSPFPWSPLSSALLPINALSLSKLILAVTFPQHCHPDDRQLSPS